MWSFGIGSENRGIIKVLKFGVSQKQILSIIKLLAMELEDREALVAISAVVNEALNEAQISSSIITTE